MSRRNCRLCWNESYWTRPTGDAQKLEDGTYVSDHGFGHEEWLFNYDWLLAGLKYGHLQPVSNSWRKLQGTTLNLNLYTFGPDRKVLSVGTIDGVRVVDSLEANEVLTEFKGRGWLDEMVSELRGLGIDPTPILEAPALELFNVAFEPGKVKLLDPMPVVPPGHPSYPSVNRYILTRADVDSASGVVPPKGSDTPTKTTLRSFRRPVPGHDVEWRHTRLQAEVHSCVSRRGHRVLYERSYVDLTVCLEDGNILLELKTLPTPRACIREGLGQLLEYAHYSSGNRVKLLVLVSRARITDSDRRYLDILNTQYYIPIAYWSFTEDQEERDPQVYPPNAAIF